MNIFNHRLYYLLSLMLALITLVGLSACSTSNTPTTSKPMPTTTQPVFTPKPPVTTPATGRTPTTTTAPTPPAPTQAPPPTPALSYTVNVANKAGLGNFLVDAKGMTLYWTTRDSVGQSNITGTTLANWPVFYVSNIVVPSSLNMMDFASITRADGNKETTFKGWPLYYYINDKASGDTLGQGLAGVWFVVNPASSAPAPTPTPTPTTTTAQNVTINLTAQNMAFDKSTITVPAGASVTINFVNKDSIPHNFALYTDSSARTSIFVGQIISATTITYKFTAPPTPGNYFFRCDVHPTFMTGTFVVQ